jgi:hypothetical protein
METYLHKGLNNRNVMYLGTELKGGYHNSNLSPYLGSNTGHESHNFVCLQIYGNCKKTNYLKTSVFI